MVCDFKCRPFVGFFNVDNEKHFIDCKNDIVVPMIQVVSSNIKQDARRCGLNGLKQMNSFMNKIAFKTADSRLLCRQKCIGIDIYLRVQPSHLA